MSRSLLAALLVVGCRGATPDVQPEAARAPATPTAATTTTTTTTPTVATTTSERPCRPTEATFSVWSCCGELANAWHWDGARCVQRIHCGCKCAGRDCSLPRLDTEADCLAAHAHCRS
jgi:hypothetical protein